MTVATLASGVLGRALRLPPPLTRSVTVRRDLPVRARDGVILRTDHYAPDLPDAPAVLVRTPYGRTGVSAVVARIIAERGFHVVASSCRGTGGSTGRFSPMRHEREDGLDTVDWLRRQPWYTGRFGTFGPSYLGFVQWAIADTPDLAAMATVVTASQIRGATYAGESFSLDTALTWTALIQAQGGGWLPNTLELLRGQPRLRDALSHLPLDEAAQVATGEPVDFFHEWLANSGSEHGYWDELGHQHRIAKVTAPVLMVGGWQDVFLPWQLRDYAALRSVGALPQLTIGPWTHGSYGLFGAALRESIGWLAAHLCGNQHAAHLRGNQHAAHLRGNQHGTSPSLGRTVLRERPVRLHIGGAERWCEFDDWPPAGTSTTEWFLHADGGLAPAVPASSTSETFRYDPQDPTPSLGGPVLMAKAAGQRDNRPLEARDDVLVYTGDALRASVRVIGPVSATVYARASRPHFDIFVRLCDVQPDGRSLNVCDGLARVTPGRFPVDAEGVQAVEVELWPTGYEFGVSHRLRVQVSGGAHPRYARNTGTGEPLGSAVSLRQVSIEVCRGPDRRSAIHLPVFS